MITCQPIFTLYLQSPAQKISALKFRAAYQHIQDSNFDKRVSLVLESTLLVGFGKEGRKQMYLWIKREGLRYKNSW